MPDPVRHAREGLPLPVLGGERLGIGRLYLLADVLRYGFHARLKDVGTRSRPLKSAARLPAKLVRDALRDSGLAACMDALVEQLISVR